MNSLYMRLLCTWLMSAVLLLGHCVDCFKSAQAMQHSCCHKKDPQPAGNEKPACPVDQVLVQGAKDPAAVVQVASPIVVAVAWQPVAFAERGSATPPLAEDRSILNHVLRI